MHSTAVSTAVMSASHFEVRDGLIVWAQACCDEVRQRSMGPTLVVLMPQGCSPPTTQFPLAPQTIISVHCRRLVKFWTNIFETDERDFQIKAIVVD